MRLAGNSRFECIDIENIHIHLFTMCAAENWGPGASGPKNPKIRVEGVIKMSASKTPRHLHKFITRSISAFYI